MTNFQYDVFLAHSSKDRQRVSRIAERLQSAGLRVWFDDWVVQPGDDLYLTMEKGLESSRALVVCLSLASLGPGWLTLEQSTLRFRTDPSTLR